MKNALIIIIISLSLNCFSQKGTDFSLFMRSDSTTYLNEKSSESGDLFTAIGHHGPAIENEWFALRIYFSNKCAIDVYSKTKPGLELREAKWYPTAQQQEEGWGADYYKVGSTVGLGGVRLWDGEKVLPLDPVTMRTAKVSGNGKWASMEMISEGVPYKNTTVDVCVKVHLEAGSRYAKVEAYSLNGEKLQFVTGINYHKDHIIEQRKGIIASWGVHPEDVAVEQIDLGAALKYNPSDFEKEIDDGTQILLVSKPTKKISTKISTANSKEPELNTMKAFMDFLEN